MLLVWRDVPTSRTAQAVTGRFDRLAKHDVLALGCDIGKVKVRSHGVDRARLLR
jgi:hypothetical protein